MAKIISLRNYIGPYGRRVDITYDINGKEIVDTFAVSDDSDYAATWVPITTAIDEMNEREGSRYTITCQDGTVLYAYDGSNDVQIDLSITLTGAQLTAWNTIKPVLKPYLAKIMKLWIAANPAQRQALRAHNAVLDAVLDMMGY